MSQRPSFTTSTSQPSVQETTSVVTIYADKMITQQQSGVFMSETQKQVLSHTAETPDLVLEGIEKFVEANETCALISG